MTPRKGAFPNSQRGVPQFAAVNLDKYFPSNSLNDLYPLHQWVLNGYQQGV